MGTTSVRLPDELVDQARREANVFSRTVSGQIEHWLKLGRALEATPGLTLDRVRAALETRLDPDELEAAEREIYEDLLGQSLDKPSDQEEAYFAKLRETSGAVGYDENGRLVRTLPGGDVEVLDED